MATNYNDREKEPSTRRKGRLYQNILSGLAVIAGLGGGKLALDNRQSMDTFKGNTAAILEPSDKHIREVCRSEFEPEIKRLERDNEQTRKDFERSLDQIIKFYDRRMK
jgi:hypothetical protein